MKNQIAIQMSWARVASLVRKGLLEGAVTRHDYGEENEINAMIINAELAKKPREFGPVHVMEKDTRHTDYPRHPHRTFLYPPNKYNYVSNTAYVSKGCLEIHNRDFHGDTVLKFKDTETERKTIGKWATAKYGDPDEKTKYENLLLAYEGLL